MKSNRKIPYRDGGGLLKCNKNTYFVAFQKKMSTVLFLFRKNIIISSINICSCIILTLITLFENPKFHKSINNILCTLSTESSYLLYIRDIDNWILIEFHEYNHRGLSNWFSERMYLSCIFFFEEMYIFYRLYGSFCSIYNTINKKIQPLLYIVIMIWW